MSSISLNFAASLAKQVRKRESPLRESRHTPRVLLLPFGSYYGGRIQADVDFERGSSALWLVEYQYLARRAYLNKTTNRGLLCKEWHRLSAFKAWWDANAIPGRKLFWGYLDHESRVPVFSPETAMWLTPEAEELFYSVAYNKSINKSGYVGVVVHYDRWEVRIQVGKKQKRLGLFDDAFEAHRVWQRDRIERLSNLVKVETDPQTKRCFQARLKDLKELYKLKQPFDHV